MIYVAVDPLNARRVDRLYVGDRFRDGVDERYFSRTNRLDPSATVPRSTEGASTKASVRVAGVDDSPFFASFASESMDMTEPFPSIS